MRDMSHRFMSLRDARHIRGLDRVVNCFPNLSHMTPIATQPLFYNVALIHWFSITVCITFHIHQCLIVLAGDRRRQTS